MHIIFDKYLIFSDIGTEGADSPRKSGAIQKGKSYSSRKYRTAQKGNCLLRKMHTFLNGKNVTV